MRFPTVTRTGHPISSASANFAPGPDDAVIEQHGQAGTLELGLDLTRNRKLRLVRSTDHDHVGVERRERRRPDHARLVVVLLDGRGGGARRTDAVGAHDDGVFLSSFVQVGGAEGHGVPGTQLEDVTNLDCRLDAERPLAAHVAGVAGGDLAQVVELGRIVATGLDSAQVPAGAVRAADVLARRGATRRRSRAPSSRPGRSSRDRRRTPHESRPRRPDGTPPRAPAPSSSRAACRRRARARAPSRRRRRSASPSPSPPGRSPSISARPSMVVAPGVSTSSGASSAGGNSGRRGRERATSRLAA